MVNKKKFDKVGCLQKKKGKLILYGFFFERALWMCIYLIWIY